MTKRQWGHGFHQGRLEEVNRALNSEKGITRWLPHLQAGGTIFRNGWIEGEILWMKNGILYKTKPLHEDDLFALSNFEEYYLSTEDLSLEWFGLQDDFSDI